MDGNNNRTSAETELNEKLRSGQIRTVDKELQRKILNGEELTEEEKKQFGMDFEEWKAYHDTERAHMVEGFRWGAINDPIMGVICDTCNPRWGRYRTWFLITPVLLVIDMFLLFSNPSFIQNSTMVKCVWVCLTYMLYGMIVTAYTMPQMAILPAMTLDDQERNFP